MRPLPVSVNGIARVWTWERTLLAAFLLGRLVLLWSRWNVEFGYDSGVHLDIVDGMARGTLFPALRSSYYAFHPPLGFAVPALLRWLGVGRILSVQLFSAACGLGSFFLLRGALRRCGLLAHPAAVFFLYLVAGLPLSVVLATAVSLDAVIVLHAAAAVFLCAGIFTRRKTDLRRWKSEVLLAAVLAAGLYTKFTGVLLLSVPFFWIGASALTRPAPVRALLLRQCAVAACVVSVAVLAALPYYYARYYRQTGMWFYTAGEDNLMLGDVVRWREVRDADPPAFFRSIALPYAVGDAHYEPRFAGVWRSLWRAEDRAPQSEAAGTAIGWYGAVFAVLAWAGLALLVLGVTRPPAAWRRWGLFLLPFTAVHLAALAYYAFRVPVPGYFSTKGIYISAASWGVCYCVAVFLDESRLKGWIYVLLLAFLLYNHLLPVY